MGEISPDEFKHFIGPDIRLEPVTLHKSDNVKSLLEYYMGKTPWSVRVSSSTTSSLRRTPPKAISKPLFFIHTSHSAMKIAIFPGSFDPFTVGHASIVERGLPMFDRIVIGVGVNDSKRSLFSTDERVEAISRIYADEPRIKVVAYNDLTVDLVRREGAQFILRGLRSVKDFEYERDIAAMNHRLSGVETVMLFTESHIADISSSVVRELIAYGKDVSDFLPRRHSPRSTNE